MKQPPDAAQTDDFVAIVDPGRENHFDEGLARASQSDESANTVADSLRPLAFVAGALATFSLACQDPTNDDDDANDDDDDDDDNSSVDDGDTATNEDSTSDSTNEQDDDVDATPGVLHVNGKNHQVGEESGRALLWILRHDLQLTGAKYGCGEAQCGACTVLVDDQAVPSCVLMVEKCWGKKIVTVEGLADGDQLSPVQQAFLDEEALQCGYCTPGMVIGVTALLKAEAKPSVQAIQTAMQNHLCRCGTYPRIIKAAQRAAGLVQLRGGR